MNRSLYTRPNKPATMPVRRRRSEGPALGLFDVPELISVDRSSECHVTPPCISARMVEYLGGKTGIVLDPQAGTGNLLRALLDGGYLPSELIAVERHSGLCDAIRARFSGVGGYALVNGCFIEYAAEMAGKVTFSRIITNPPFSQVKKHMNAALSLLGSCVGDSATMVALVPVTYEHEDACTIEVLGCDTFANTKVMTKVIKFEYSH